MVKNAEEIPDPFLRRVDDVNCPTPRFCNRHFPVRDTQLRCVEKVGEVAVYGSGPQDGKRRTRFGWDKAMFAHCKEPAAFGGNAIQKSRRRTIRRDDFVAIRYGNVETNSPVGG